MAHLVLVLEVKASGFRGQIPVALNLLRIFWLEKAFLSANEVHWAKSSFLYFFALFLVFHKSLYALNATLNGLKQVILRGCNP